MPDLMKWENITRDSGMYEHEVGVCPACNTFGIIYEDEGSRDGSALIYKYTCEECGMTGDEIYQVAFSHHRLNPVGNEA